MAASLYQLGIGIEATDDASGNIDRIAESMQGLFERVDQLRDLGVGVTLGGIGEAASDLANSLATDYSALEGIAPLAEAATDRMIGLGESTDTVTDSMAMLPAEVEAFQAALSALTSEMDEMETRRKGWADAGKAYKDSFWGKLASFDGKGLKGSLRDIGEEIQGAADAMMSFGETGAQATALDLEDATQKMATALGGGRKEAQALRMEIIDGATSSKYAVGEYLKLAGGLSEVGVSLSSLTQDTRDDFVALSETFGMNATDLGRMHRLIPQMGGDFNALRDDTTKIAASLGVDVRGAFQALPGVIDHTRQATAEYSSEIVGSGPQITRSLLRTGAVFSKVFGKDMGQAINDAQASFDRFTGELNTFSNVFIGMESDFGPTVNALQEAGINIFEAQDLMRQGQDDPIAFAGSMRDVAASLGEGSVRHKRFMEQLRSSGMDMTLIRDNEAYASAIEQQAKARAYAVSEEKKADDAFKNLTNSMLDTTKEMKSMFSNTWEATKAILYQEGVLDVLKESFAKAKEQVADFTRSVVKFVQTDEFRGWVKSVKPLLSGVGSLVLNIGTAFAGLTAVGGSMIGFFAGFKTLAFGAKAAVKPLGLLGKIMLGPFALFGKSVTGATAALSTLGTKGVGPVAKGIGWLVSKTPGVTRLGDAFSRFGGVIKTIGKKGLGKLTDAGGFIRGLFGKASTRLATSRIGQFFAGISGKVLGAVGGIAKAVPGVLAKFGSKFLKVIPGLGQIIAVIGGIKTAISDMGAVMGDPNATGAEKFQALLRGVIKGVGETINGLFLGIPGFLLKKFFPGMERTFDKGFAGVMDKVFGGDGLSATLGKWWDKGVAFLGKMLDKVPGLVKASLPGIQSFGEAVGGVMGGLAGLMWDGLVWGIKTLWKFSPIGLIVNWMTEDKEAVSEGEGHMYETMLAMGQAGLDALGSLGTGMLDGLFKSMGSSLDIALLQMELAWVGMKNTMSETWNSIKVSAFDGWNRITNTIMAITNDYLIGPLNTAITGIAEAFPLMFRSITGSLNTFLSKMPSNMPGLASMRAQIVAMNVAVDGMAANVGQIPQVSAKTEAQLLSARNKFAAAQVSEDEKESARRESRLAASLSEAQTVLRNTQTASKNFSDWKKAEAQGLDGILTQFRNSDAARERFNTTQMNAAERSLEDHLDSTMRSLSSRVRSGNMTFDAAKAEWVKQVAEGRAEAIRAGNNAERRENQREEGRRTAADASKRAGGNKGISGAQWAQFLGRLEQSRKADPNVGAIRVRLEGGDRVSRVLATESNRRNAQGAANSGV